MATDCTACEALRAEVTYLRTQVERLQDRLLAVASPAAFAQVSGQVPAQTTAAIESYIDDQGQAWVTVGGRQVKLEDYNKLMEQAAVPLLNGQMVPDTELRRSMEKLDEMMGGRS